jgi:hypothetical protein
LPAGLNIYPRGANFTGKSKLWKVEKSAEDVSGEKLIRFNISSCEKRYQ